MSESRCRKVRMNLIQQNVYVRDVVPHAPKSSSVPDSYVSCDRVQEGTGFYDKFTVQPYPYTKEYVKSFAASADYRNSIEDAVRSTPPGRNLGDLTEQQDLAELFSRDPQAFAKVKADLEARLAAVNKVSAPAPENKSDDEVK